MSSAVCPDTLSAIATCHSGLFHSRRSDLAKSHFFKSDASGPASVSDGNLQLSVGSLISFLTHMRPIKLSTLETWALETETIHRAAWSE